MSIAAGDGSDRQEQRIRRNRTPLYGVTQSGNWRCDHSREDATYNNGTPTHTLWPANDNDFLQNVSGAGSNPNQFFVFGFADAELTGRFTFRRHQVLRSRSKRSASFLLAQEASGIIRSRRVIAPLVDVW
jgi:hypothetical protein